jgi:L-threonylcarbamoyladenylate synthase
MDLHKMPEILKADKAGIKYALNVLKRGGTVVFPTETLYGLGAASTDGEAVEKIYRIKKRPPEKLLPVIVGSMEQAKDYFILSRNDLKLANKFWPGPLSLILRTKSKKLMTALKGDSLAVRFSADPIAGKLAQLLGAPLISTSANTSGKSVCFTIAAVKRQFAGNVETEQPDLFLDGGGLKKSLPSTIVRTEKNGPSLIREGKIPFAKIIEELIP